MTTCTRKIYYYIKLDELQGFLLLWKHDIFTCEEKFDIFTWEISVTSYVLSSLPSQLFNEPKFISIWSKHLRRLLGNIRQLSVIFGHFRKIQWSKMFVWTSDSLRRIFENLRNSLENVRKSSTLVRTSEISSWTRADNHAWAFKILDMGF